MRNGINNSELRVPSLNAELMEEKLISELYQEADEILAMVMASIKTAKRNKS